ncbi:MAG: hydantoinase B/oxoprolinase family protein [Rhizobiales bacterium]|nr:hydantoinase B/oxoprolinase family protein [Hyphomicrobiales bacterium]
MNDQRRPEPDARHAVGGVDAVTLEIIRGKLLAVVDEMGLSPVIYEVLDFACGICDPAGQLIAQTNGITVFTGTFSTQIGAVLRKFGGNIHPGDVFIMNNPYEGGTHLCDVAVMKPVFIGERFVAFAIALAHWSEVGGKTPGSLPPDATEVFQEGIRFPALKLFDRGVRQDAIYEIIETNVRLPRMSLGDLNAELASVRIADIRLAEVADKYGVDRLGAAFDHILASSERLSRAAVAAIPDGTYEATDWIDGDGITTGRFPVRVAITIAGDRMTADFTGSSPQLAGPVNCARGALVSAVKTVFKAVVDPQAPSNDGWFRPLDVVAPPGTVFTAEPPAPVGWYYEGTGHASELVWKALAPVLSERVSAGSSNSLCVTVLAGQTEDGGEPYVLVEPGMVGWGGTGDRDGASVVSAITNGDTFNYSIELLEAKFPLRVHAYTLNTAGGVGAGRHRGGFGSIRDYEILSPSATLSASFGRSIERPWGLSGGGTGSCNRLEVVKDGEVIHGARMPTLELRRGDRLKLVTGGGGGFGDPFERPVDDVRADVAGGYISAEEASGTYGVAVLASGDVDVEATARLRARHGVA